MYNTYILLITLGRTSTFSSLDESELPIFPPKKLSVRLSVCLSVCLSVRLSVQKVMFFFQSYLPNVWITDEA